MEQKVLELLPLGGSECFRQVGEEYRVDVNYVVDEAKRRHTAMTERFKNAVIQRSPTRRGVERSGGQ